MGASAAITLLLGLLDRAAAIGTLIRTARNEGRDVSEAELDDLMAKDDTARADLVAAIAAARARP